MIINKFITGLLPVHVYFVILSEETIGKKLSVQSLHKLDKYYAISILWTDVDIQPFNKLFLVNSSSTLQQNLDALFDFWRKEENHF